MGTYTTNLKLYKPDAKEFVNPETQLNRNWDIADKYVKRLLEYEFTTVPVPDVADATNRMRFYKTYSNSFMAWFPSVGFWQDPKARVHDAVPAVGYCVEGFTQHADLPIYYRVIKNTSGTISEVEWIGAVTYVTGELMESGFNLTFMNSLPAEVTPPVAKYFTMSAGNTSSNYSIARVAMFTDGTMQYKRYGSDPAVGFSTENRIELTGIRYSMNVTG